MKEFYVSKEGKRVIEIIGTSTKRKSFSLFQPDTVPQQVGTIITL